MKPVTLTESGGLELGYFEEMFLKRTYYSGEHKLDRVLESLLFLSESCKEEEAILNGLKITRLIQVDNFKKLIQNCSQRTKRQFKLESKERNFSYFEFSKCHNVRYNDLMSGLFPMVFTDYRRVLHCLKLSHAIHVTLQMQKITVFGPIRKRGNRFVNSGVNPLTRLFVHLYAQLRFRAITDEKDIIKCFKNSLCLLVSESMDQSELPDGPKIEILPFFLKQQIFRMDEKKKVSTCFSILQSKSLCQEVPKSFVQDALKKHRDQLTTPHKGLSPDTLTLLEQQGIMFGKRVQKYYSPEKGFFPTGKATFSFPRKIGGVKGDLVYQGRLSNDQRFSHLDRPEPLVIGIFGQPGQGKSLLLAQLRAFFHSIFPGVPYEDLFYARTSNCDHWDGYRQQPVTILDDIGQSRKGSDLQEFQTLVSCNPYVLPMANLNEKGMYFTSEIIIVTSNIPFGTTLHTLYEGESGIIEPHSFWRRFHVPIFMESNQIYKLKDSVEWLHHSALIKPRKSIPGTESARFNFSSIYLNHLPRTSIESWEEWDIESLKTHIKKVKKEREFFHKNSCTTWNQSIYKRSETSDEKIGKQFIEQQLKDLEKVGPKTELDDFFSFTDQLLPEIGMENIGGRLVPKDSRIANLRFDAFPPDGPLKVRVEPITEPLKVRTITAGQGELFCLKPLQRAMWLALGDFPQYVLTHGTQNLEPSISRIFKNSKEGEVWISGDYTAATDSVAIEASCALMKGILSQIDHEPTKRWAMKELEPHLLVYPKGSGIEPSLQKSGQLMGSLLSFPLLCLLNDCTAKFSGLSPDQYLINGDDILMRADPSVYPIWKTKVDEFGLSLSLGKNYIHPHFGTVNSQLIFNGEVLQSGKQCLLDRRVQVLGECLRDLEIQMDQDTPDDVQNLFKRFNRRKLSKTVRSIRVPVSHGGLAFSWGKSSKVESKRTEILVYLHDLFKKIEPHPGFLNFPYLSFQKLEESSLDDMERCFNEPISNKEFLEDFLTRPNVEKVKGQCKLFPNLQHLFWEKNIEDLPPLTSIQIHQIPYVGNDKVTAQRNIHLEFLTHFLQYQGDYSYLNFRKRFLQTILGLKIDEIEPKHLFQLYDIEFPSSLLDGVSIACQKRSSVSFDSKLFTTKLGSDLTPKQFGLNVLPVEEYRKVLEEDFNNLFECSKPIIDSPVDLNIIRKDLLLVELKKEVRRKF